MGISQAATKLKSHVLKSTWNWSQEKSAQSIKKQKTNTTHTQKHQTKKKSKKPNKKQKNSRTAFSPSAEPGMLLTSTGATGLCPAVPAGWILKIPSSLSTTSRVVRCCSLLGQAERLCYTSQPWAIRLAKINSIITRCYQNAFEGGRVVKAYTIMPTVFAFVSYLSDSHLNTLDPVKVLWQSS